MCLADRRTHCPDLSADCHKPLNMTPCLISCCQIRRKKWPVDGWVCAAGHINSDVYRSYCLKLHFAQPLSVMILVQPAGGYQKCVVSLGVVTELLTSVTIRRVYWYVTGVSEKGEHCCHLEGSLELLDPEDGGTAAVPNQPHSSSCNVKCCNLRCFAAQCSYYWQRAG